MITQARLKELVSYDPETGVFRWRKDHVRQKAGAEAGGNNLCGYRKIGLDGTRYYAHRLAFLYMTGAIPSCLVDHADGNGHNNAWSNLRLCNRAQNAANSKKVSTNTSGFKGVTWNTKDEAWVAQIKVGNKHISLGYFKRKEDAANAYNAGARKFFGEFARVNNGASL